MSRRRSVHQLSFLPKVRLDHGGEIGQSRRKIARPYLHLLIRARKRRDLQAFLRTISGRIACLVTGARKTATVGRFWDRLAYSRIVSFGREFRAVHAYLVKNLLEAAGVWDRKQPPVLDSYVASLTRALRNPAGGAPP